MDYQMPMKNGLETTKEILKINNYAKIIFISCFPDVKESALSIGAVLFIEKPFELQELIISIDNVLAVSLEENNIS